MVFRRFHRTLGPWLLLALLGVAGALLLALFRPVQPAPLRFVGWTNSVGLTKAILAVPVRKFGSSWFNMISTDRQICYLTYAGQDGVGSNIQAVTSDEYVDTRGASCFSVSLPLAATSICVTVQQRVRKGRVDLSANSPGGGPRVLFTLPWGQTETYTSGQITIPLPSAAK